MAFREYNGKEEEKKGLGGEIEKGGTSKR